MVVRPWGFESLRPHLLWMYLQIENGRMSRRGTRPFRCRLPISPTKGRFRVDYRIGFEVADGGRLHIAIPPSDLRSGRFDRVCGIFDSA